MTPSDSSAPALARRKFLAVSGATLAAAAVGRAIAAPATSAAPAPSRQGVPIGIELYAVRQELTRDLPHTLREVARIGYEAVEFYAPYFGWAFPYAKEVRARLDDLGLRCLSTHNHLVSFANDDGLGQAIELNQILGTRQVVLSSAPRTTVGAEAWKTLAAQLTTAVEKLRPHGLTAGFHNHQSEWAQVEGEQRIMDLLAAHTPPEFVLQLDVGTALEAGVDPVAWIKSHPGRIKSVHLKDWAPGEAAAEKGYRVLFGEGVAPWAEIIAAAESVGGVEVFLMEQEGSRYSEFETAERCLATWKKLRGAPAAS